MGDPERDGSLDRSEWGATLHAEKNFHLHPHALKPEHRHELLSTLFHEAMHVTHPSMSEKEVERTGNRLAEFYEANPHIYALFSRYKPLKRTKKCPCGKA